MGECRWPIHPLALLTLSYVCYLLLGALTVSLVERPHEVKLRNELRLLKSRLLNASACLPESDLDHFLSRVLTADRYGVSVLDNSSQYTNWDFASAFFFASTLVTTVGYGHTTPLSNGGKAFSIIFILVGVPLTMLFLTALVQRLMLYLTTQPIRLCQERFSYTRQQITWIHLFVLTLMVLITFFIIPSAIFSAIEAEWSFSDAFYFCFISLSTIGLGDFVPAEQSNQRLRPLYKFSVTFFLLCGLVTMLFVLNTVHAAVGLHGLTQIFYLPPAEDEEDETEGTILQPQSPAEHPSYKSILPSENR
ncbi:potassium channel subfamily K member 1-like isoform X1 [Hypanus sabinus]|uniref:potassium channel subfamily K member 1-like isoform X1 n=1 Tax=Hypanus sabinus TaxID=79690 RepID=UPI0028C405CA|nr:potassium channel subfamily K member 1-like isoform X1 [Hypanus sabinus]